MSSFRCMPLAPPMCRWRRTCRWPPSPAGPPSWWCTPGLQGIHGSAPGTECSRSHCSGSPVGSSRPSGSSRRPARSPMQYRLRSESRWCLRRRSLRECNRPGTHSRPGSADTCRLSTRPARSTYRWSCRSRCHRPRRRPRRRPPCWSCTDGCPGRRRRRQPRRYCSGCTSCPWRTLPPRPTLRPSCMSLGRRRRTGSPPACTAAGTARAGTPPG